MFQFLNIFLLCMCFSCAQSEECSGMKLGKTACVPKEHVNTIQLPPNSPLPIYVLMDKLKVTEIDIRSSTLTVVMSLDLSWNDDRINFKKPNDTINFYFERFMEEWKMIYIPYIYVKNYINIRYHKISGHDLLSQIIVVENNEPMVLFTTVFDVSVHCELQDSIVKFPFDKHSCKVEVSYSLIEG